MFLCIVERIRNDCWTFNFNSNKGILHLARPLTTCMCSVTSKTTEGAVESYSQSRTCLRSSRTEGVQFILGPNSCFVFKKSSSLPSPRTLDTWQNQKASDWDMPVLKNTCSQQKSHVWEKLACLRLALLHLWIIIFAAGFFSSFFFLPSNISSSKSSDSMYTGGIKQVLSDIKSSR